MLETPGGSAAGANLRIRSPPLPTGGDLAGQVIQQRDAAESPGDGLGGLEDHDAVGRQVSQQGSRISGGASRARSWATARHSRLRAGWSNFAAK